VHQELVLEGAPQAVEMTKVIDARTPRVDARPQRSDYGLAEVCALRRAEAAGGAQRVNAGAKQCLVRVDVAHPRDPALIEQKRLDRRSSPARESPQILEAEPLVKRLQTQARREEALERLAAEQKLTSAEAAGVHYHQLQPTISADAA
jgi:hypothetical protein